MTKREEELKQIIKDNMSEGYCVDPVKKEKIHTVAYYPELLLKTLLQSENKRIREVLEGLKYTDQSCDCSHQGTVNLHHIDEYNQRIDRAIEEL